MGCARSGSTLLMQYLTSTGYFSYPSNLIARFWKSPYIGVLVQNAISDLISEESYNFFSSRLGKTEGPFAPSEFWYFWREHFKFGNTGKLSVDELKQSSPDTFIKKLSAFEQLTNKPLVMKGMILNWNIPELHTAFPKFIFLNITRNIVDNALSLYNARKSFFGDPEKWYSFRPPEYSDLKNKTVEEQVVGQVYFTQKAVADGLNKIPEANKISISYEAFCEKPDSILKMLNTKLSLLGYNEILEKRESKPFIYRSYNQNEKDSLILNMEKAKSTYDQT